MNMHYFKIKPGKREMVYEFFRDEFDWTCLHSPFHESFQFVSADGKYAKINRDKTELHVFNLGRKTMGKLKKILTE